MITTHCVSTFNPAALLLLSLSPQPPSLMTRWSAAGASAWPSRWPKTASTKAAIARSPASWRWTSSNCCETVNMRWGKQVSNQGVKMTGNYHGGDGALVRQPPPSWVWREMETEKIRKKVVNTGPTSGSSSRRVRLLSFKNQQACHL